MSYELDIADLDVIYLSYDEPKKEEFWVKISNIVPWAKRIDGVKGSDSAHKAAAELSSTDRFILIDGDNLPYTDFFGKTLVLNDKNKDYVFRWKARNDVNNLVYGNGGLSCWTKKFVQEMKTHENSAGNDETDIEFCFDPKYIPMHDCYSTTYPNGSPFHAWRAGFREGVKLSLNRGKRPITPELRLPKINLDRLSIWHNIGADAKNGLWAILGARMGTHMTLCTSWDYKEVQSFSLLQHIWDTSTACHPITEEELKTTITVLGSRLKNELNLQIVDFDVNQSKFFKQQYSNIHQNKGIMVTEMEFLSNE